MTRLVDESENTRLHLINLGCGNSFHRDWTNLDLVATDPAVQQHDILAGIPFGANSIDAIYHSHVLEHLTLEQGERMLRECYRVLIPGGILRIVVPDLEQIAKLYLQQHEMAWLGDETAAGRYEWMKLELLDQMVRCQSGGRMGRYMAELKEDDAEFVRARLGHEFLQCRQSEASRLLVLPRKRQSGHLKNWRERLAFWTLGKLLGSSARAAFLESLFRSRGEVHRWMYDRYSLRSLCQSLGFVEFRICNATSSSIPKFESYQLDSCGNEVRKPDSLFCECIKPRSACSSSVEAA